MKNCRDAISDKKLFEALKTKRTSSRGFTLLQIVVVLCIIAILSSILLGVVGRGRSAARRAECDAHLKEIAMALDTYRQENGQYPAQLSELVTKKYLPASSLRCPADPDPNSNGYADFYVVREPLDSEELPVVVCPFHEGNGSHGAQAYKGRYTSQYLTQPATLVSAVGTTVYRPGQKSAVGTAGMQLHGADRIVTGATGAAVIRFADNSTASLTMNCDVRLLQSFVDGQSQGPLYTLMRQNVPQSIGGGTTANTVTYVVNHGSSFDVATPTATAGALGTEFSLKVVGTTDADTTLTVLDSTVALTDPSLTEQIFNDKVTVPTGVSVKPGNGDPGRQKKRKPRERGKGKGKN